MTTYPKRPFRGDFRSRRQPQDTHRINDRIMAREIRVIGSNGEQVGIMNVKDAVALAAKEGLDLVEISPQAKPPVCKILDYGKFKYWEQKKEAESKKKRTETVVKELRIRYRTDVGDFETKLKHAREFLEEGDKVKFSMRFQGREAMHINLGREKLDLIVEKLSDIAEVDERSPTAGRQIYIIFRPKRGAPAPKPPKQDAAS